MSLWSSLIARVFGLDWTELVPMLCPSKIRHRQHYVVLFSSQRRKINDGTLFCGNKGQARRTISGRGINWRHLIFRLQSRDRSLQELDRSRSCCYYIIPNPNCCRVNGRRRFYRLVVVFLLLYPGYRMNRKWFRPIFWMNSILWCRVLSYFRPLIDLFCRSWNSHTYLFRNLWCNCQSRSPPFPG